MKYIKFILLCLIISSCASENAENGNTGGNKKLESPEEDALAKRSAPKEVKPIRHQGMEYHAALNEIIAINSEAKDTVWRKIIYKINYDLELEKDIQDVFIDSLVLLDNSLLIRNEDGSFFTVNLDDQSIFPDESKVKKVDKTDYTIKVSELSNYEFDATACGDTSDILFNKEQCLSLNRISSNSPHEYKLLLNSGEYYTLKKVQEDEQFFGYQFHHYDSLRNIYVLWENWLEAGHPIMINAANGELTSIYGYDFIENGNKTMSANFAEDIGSGWTPNGIVLFQKTSVSYDKLFEFNPNFELNENWGPIEIKWKNDSAILIHAIANSGTGGYEHLYKQLEFKKK